MSIIFCDKNEKLVKKIKKVVGDTFECVCGDVIEEHNKRPDSRIVTASNPDFSPDGGLDKVLADQGWFTGAREFIWNDHLFFVVSVDKSRRSSRSIVLRALAGVYGYRFKYDLIVTGLGMGVGGLDEKVLVEMFTNLRFANLSYTDLRFANLSYTDLRSANLSFTDLRSANLSYTEYDGLTVNEFIKKYGLKKKGTKLYLFKGVTQDLESPVIDSEKFRYKYEVGKTVEEKICSFSVVDTCKNGLHVCPTIEKAKEYGSKVLKVEVDIGDFVAIPNQDGKVRVKKLKVVEEV